MKEVIIVFTVVLLMVGCTTQTIQKRDAKAANVDQNIGACGNIIPDNIAELSAAGQQAIGDAVDRYITLILIQQGK